MYEMYQDTPGDDACFCSAIMWTGYVETDLDLGLWCSSLYKAARVLPKTQRISIILS